MIARVTIPERASVPFKLTQSLLKKKKKKKKKERKKKKKKKQTKKKLIKKGSSLLPGGCKLFPLIVAYNYKGFMCY